MATAARSRSWWRRGSPAGSRASSPPRWTSWPGPSSATTRAPRRLPRTRPGAIKSSGPWWGSPWPRSVSVRVTRHGGLEIDVDDDGVLVFVNERYEAVGDVAKDDLVPGRYRVYVQKERRGVG